MINISVVICTYNREKFLKGALLSLLGQDIGKEKYEIIVVNNNSTDSTEKIIQQFIKDFPDHDASYHFESNQGLAFARNRGIKESKGEIITYIDDDAIAPKDFLSRVIYNFRDQDVVGLGGKVIPKYEIRQPEWMNPYLNGFVTKFDLGDKGLDFNTHKAYPTGCNMSYRRSALIECGGFNNSLKWRADDKQIYQSIHEAFPKLKIVYDPGLWVFHQIDEYRTTDENFSRLARLIGQEEANRISNADVIIKTKKILEFIFKWGAGFLLFLFYFFTGTPVKGRYILRYRYLALMSLLKTFANN